MPKFENTKSLKIAQAIMIKLIKEGKIFEMWDHMEWERISLNHPVLLNFSCSSYLVIIHLTKKNGQWKIDDLKITTHDRENGSVKTREFPKEEFDRYFPHVDEERVVLFMNT